MATDRRRTARRRVTPLILIVLGWLLVLPAAGYLFYSSEVQNPDAVEMPSSLAGYPLRSARYEEQAVADVARLHRREFPLTSAGVGSYGEGGEINLWAAGSFTDFLAARMVVAMEASIASSDSPFIPTGISDRVGREIYELDGMGQRHFYFQSDNLVIWLAADPMIAEDALADTLEFYR